MKRNMGLDLARAAAILLVLVTHGSTFFLWNHYDVLAFSYVTGYYGVEIFFVLSGYLIGGIMIREIIEGGSLFSLLHFYIRRWLRTLPLYFLIVSVTALLIGREFHWFNLFFLQNFDEQALGFMPVSWSLTIEEWFYLAIPALLLVTSFFYKGSRGRYMIGMCIFVLIIELAARAYYVWGANPVWDYGIRKNILLRMDSLVTGVLLAAVQHYYPEVYSRRIRSKYTLLGAVALLMICGIAVYTYIDGESIDSSFFAGTFLFTLVSAAFAVCIAALEGGKAINAEAFTGGIWSRIITFLSATSYAAYLTHWEIFIYYRSLLENPDIYASYGLCIFALTVTWFLSHTLHKLWEKPFMNLRDKLPGRATVNMHRSSRIDL